MDKSLINTASFYSKIGTFALIYWLSHDLVFILFVSIYVHRSYNVPKQNEKCHSPKQTQPNVMGNVDQQKFIFRVYFYLHDHLATPGK